MGSIRYRVNNGCLPVTVELMGGGIPVQSWIHNEFGEHTFENLPLGSYTLQWTDACGCTDYLQADVELCTTTTTTIITTTTSTSTSTTTSTSTSTSTTTTTIPTTTTTTLPCESIPFTFEVDYITCNQIAFHITSAKFDVTAKILNSTVFDWTISDLSVQVVTLEPWRNDYVLILRDACERLIYYPIVLPLCTTTSTTNCDPIWTAEFIDHVCEQIEEVTTTTTTCETIWQAEFIDHVCEQIEITTTTTTIITTTTSTSTSTSTSTTTTTIAPTTTTTTICPCNGEELEIAVDGAQNTIAATWGSYGGVTQEQYNFQTFTLENGATITRIGINVIAKVGNPVLDVKLMLIDTIHYPVGDPYWFPYATIYQWSSNTIHLEGDPPGWIYFCFNCHLNASPSQPYAFTVELFNHTPDKGGLNDDENYFVFATKENDYDGGTFGFKITPRFYMPYGEPVEEYDLASKICLSYDVTTTTTTVGITTTTTTTSEVTTTTTTQEVTTTTTTGPTTTTTTQNCEDFCRYGLLYNWYAVDTGKLAPENWHVATLSEWDTLNTWLTNNGYGYGGSGSDVAKSASDKCTWKNYSTPGTPGNDPSSNNSSGFSGLPTGLRKYNTGVFADISEDTYWWTSSVYSSTDAKIYFLQYSNAYLINYYYYHKKYGFAVRCVRDTYEGWENDVPVVDYDGNEYDVVEIGTQLWLVQNLKVTHYNDGETIPNVTDNSTWGSLTTGACCAYNNDWETYACVPEPTTTTTTVAPTTTTTTTTQEVTTTTTTAEVTTTTTTFTPEYLPGALYNWRAVIDTHGLAPEGWHIPSDDEWNTFLTYLSDNGYGYGGSGSDTAKAISAKTIWKSSDVAGSPGNDSTSNNATCFSMLPSGHVSSGGGMAAACSILGYSHQDAFLWSSYDDGGRVLHAGESHYVYFYYSSTTPSLINDYKEVGNSVRCIRDTDEGWVEGEQMEDYDGNLYDTIKIGTQIWTRQNLTTTHYKDGTDITYIPNQTTNMGIWTATEGCYCFNCNHPEYNGVEPIECTQIIYTTTTTIAPTTTTTTATPTTTTTTAEVTTTTTTEAITTTTTTIQVTTTTTTECTDEIKYGALYNWYAVNNSSGIAPDGWHVPTNTEYSTLITWLTDNGYGYGGSGNDIAKSIAVNSGWNVSGDAGVVGNNQSSNNSSGWSGKPTGYTMDPTYFSGRSYSGRFWCSNESSTSNAYCYILAWFSDIFEQDTFDKNMGYSVRCIRDSSEGWNPGDHMVDYDGYTYDTIQLGTQIWTIQNLATRHYKNGDTIAYIKDHSQWDADVTGAMTAYNFDWTDVCCACTEPPVATTTTTAEVTTTTTTAEITTTTTTQEVTTTTTTV